MYIVDPDDIPASARQDYIIVDDRAAARQEVTIDGKLKQQVITINPVEVERLSKEFGVLKYHAIELDDEMLDKMKKVKEDTSVEL